MNRMRTERSRIEIRATEENDGFASFPEQFTKKKIFRCSRNQTERESCVHVCVHIARPEKLERPTKRGRVIACERGRNPRRDSRQNGFFLENRLRITGKFTSVFCRRRRRRRASAGAGASASSYSSAKQDVCADLARLSVGASSSPKK